jgi:phage anti-repressor protein
MSLLDILSTSGDEFTNYLISNFETEYQKQFVSNYGIYLKYGDDNTKYVIDFDNIWKLLEFSQKIHAKRLLNSKFIENIDYKILLSFSGEQKIDVDNRGGHNKEIIMLNVSTFKEFCMKANTAKAKEIRIYYIQMENLLLKYITNKNISILSHIDETLANNKHTILTESFDKRKVIYIGLVEKINDKMLIKIGQTQNILERIPNLNKKYNTDIQILELFECENYIPFENYILHHEYVMQFKYNKYINNIYSREAYIVSIEELNEIINIIKRDIVNFQNYDIQNIIELEKIRIQKRELDIKKEELKLESLKLQTQINNIEAETSDSNNESDVELTEYQLKQRLSTRSPKVFQYDKTTLKKIKEYDSIIETVRINKEISVSALKKASAENTEYKEYRWLLVDRNLTEEVILPPTIKSSSQRHDYVAMININKTKIMEVFASQKEAKIARQFKTIAAISNAIKRETLSSGHYWKFLSECEDNMRIEYLKNNILPNKIPNHNSIEVYQMHPQTNKIINTYYSITEVCKKFQISRLSIMKSSTNNIPHAGYKWKINYANE